MKTVKTLLVAAVMSLFLVQASGCAHISAGAEYLGDVINDNPQFVNFAGRQVVLRYIARGDTEADRAARAIEVDKVANKVRVFVSDAPRLTVDVLLAELDALIPWGKMSVEDRALVADIVSMFEMEIRAYEVDSKTRISNESRIALDAFLVTLSSAAKLALL